MPMVQPAQNKRRRPWKASRFGREEKTMTPEVRESGRSINIFIDDEPPITGARIKVIGVGGGGGNAVNRMIDSGIEGIEFVVANTDLQALKRSRASVKIQLGGRLTKGLGTGGAPIVASLATELGALTVAVVTKPFQFEGRRRLQQAEQGLNELHESVDTVITIPNERLFGAVPQGASFADAFKAADDVLRQAVQGISDLITVPGLINLDFADVRTIMQGMGMALMGTGYARGENRAIEATQEAISSPLLEEASIKGARGVLINITGGHDLTLFEVNEAASIVREEADEDANINFGHVIHETMAAAVEITVIATGFRRDVVTASAAAQMPITPPPRYAPRSPEEFPGSQQSSKRVDDLDVPTFIRKKAD